MKKLYCLLGIVLLIWGCKSSANHSSRHLSELFKSWDTITDQVLPDIAIQKKTGIDLFSRDVFLTVLQQNNGLNIGFTKRVLIIESISSGENVSNRKFLIDLTRRSQNCYAFFKDIRGNWELYTVTDMDEKTIHYIMDIPLEDKDQLWSNDVKDVLLLSLFDKSKVKIKPILSETKIKEVISCLP